MSLLPSRLFFRITVKSREVYVLKIISLAIAFAASTLITLFALHEFGYDRFPDYDRIFRVLQKNNDEHYDGNRRSNKVPFEVFSRLRSLSPDSTIAARVKILDAINIISPNGTFRHQKIHAADIAITDIFTFGIEDGSLQQFRNNDQSVIISASAAAQFFGTRRAAGRTISISSLGDTLTFTVEAVYRDFPDNTHERFQFFLHYDPSNIRALHFDHLKSGVYGKTIHSQTAFPHSIQNKLSFSENITYEFQPVAEIYFGPRVMGEDTRHGDHYSITILIAITALILFLALTTFINLTTLTLPYRAKEIAVKKLAGISQSGLLLAFATESFSIVAVSALLGAVLLALTSGLFEAALSIDLFSLLLKGDAGLMLIWTGFFILFAIAPMFMVQRFTKATPNQLLSTETISFPQLKRAITFLQLGISIFLIVASMVIRRQINYSLLKEPGRNHDQIVYVSYPKDLTDQGLRSLRSAWKQYHPNIIDVMGTTQLPNGVKSKDLNSPFYFMSVDPAFRDFFQLNMISGNWFRANAGDSVFVVNKKAKNMSAANTIDVIGVFEDISERFNQPEKPLKINVAPYYNFNYLCIRILEVDIRRTVNFLSDYFSNNGNKAVISYLDKNFERWLHYQDGLNALSAILAILSGVLSCCAIYGLSLSLVREKLKQIAIHKLFGAGTLNITRLLVNGFTRQVLIAVLVFGPLSYLILKELLRSFVYATSFQWLDAFFPLLYCGTVIFLLCGFQARSLNRQDLSAALKG